MISRSLTAAMILITLCTFSQEEEISLGYGVDILDQIEIEFLPEEGTFATLQIIALKAPKSYAIDFFSSFILIDPIYVKIGDDGIRRYYVGLYNSIEEPRRLRKKMDCIFGDAGITFFKNGKRFHPKDSETFNEGNIIENRIDDSGAMAEMNSILKKAYHRIQVGYYEHDGLPTSETKIYAQLKAQGYKFKQEKYRYGRLYVSKKKYKSYDEAIKAKTMIDEIAGRSSIIKSYHEEVDIDIRHLLMMNDCLME